LWFLAGSRRQRKNQSEEEIPESHQETSFPPPEPPAKIEQPREEFNPYPGPEDRQG
jgi:hypothetical protein